MAKEERGQVALKHLEGFGITGAKFKSPGNIPTGHFALDFAIHFGCDPSNVDLNTLEGYDPAVPLGIPLGKVVEFFGEEGSGKSSIAYRVAGYAQKMGYTVAWLDAEHSFSEDLATINGCSVEDIIYPDNNLSAEQFLDLIISLCETKQVPMQRGTKKVMVDSPRVIILDSVASLIPKAVGETLSDQQYMGLLARIMSQNLGKVAAAVERNNVLLIFINQLREKIGVMFGNPETSPGGRALKHFFSLRLKMTKNKAKDALIYKVDDDSGDEVLIGRRSYIRLEKNRFAKPLIGSIEIPIYYEPYFPNLEEVVFDVGRQTKLISVRKGVFSWNEIKMDSKPKFIEYIREKKLLDDLIKEVKEKAKENGVLLPPELMQYNKGVVNEKSDSSNLQRDRKAEDRKSSEEQSKK